jgi:hypothetical protein
MLIKIVSAAAGLNSGNMIPVKCKYCGKCLDKGRKSIELCNKCVKRKG